MPRAGELAEAHKAGWGCSHDLGGGVGTADRVQVTGHDEDRASHVRQLGEQVDPPMTEPGPLSNSRLKTVRATASGSTGTSAVVTFTG